MYGFIFPEEEAKNLFYFGGYYMSKKFVYLFSEGNAKMR